MVINKINKSLQSRPDLPNTNWLGNDWYVVDDFSPLAEKIRTLFPHFDFVLNENGELADVIEIPKTQEEINAERELEIRAELEALDNTINRATEDLYTLTELTPYKSTQDVINRKIELRDELKILQKGEM